MKVFILFILILIISSCEVCKDCKRTYFDNNGNAIQTLDEEICGTNKEVKRKEGIQYQNGVKTEVNCK